MRSAYDQSYGGSATPIYDSLCAEYRRLFRALPGDRTGEEELRFVGFSTIRPITGSGSGGWRDYGRHHELEPPVYGYPPAQLVAPAALPPGSL
ncbi:hypothetical protein E1265_09880 [Streptomyces sp. 8K308]|uniref:hypothetical protein n=1 Tax=Streptomyces sp. 8K308 TaxID=2530388 RepID=UPI00104CA4E3|nr:hypothetical protein [Streptomyces sp. 8K308]TDC24370.1 hypothetical protein E1265_09880 [Streptomyces sp. 8K308]